MTVTTIASGNWGDNSTWDTNAPPEPGDDVVIAGFDVYFPMSGDLALASLTANVGNLTLAGTATLSITSLSIPNGQIAVEDGGNVTIEFASIVLGSGGDGQLRAFSGGTLTLSQQGGGASPVFNIFTGNPIIKGCCKP